MRVGFEELVARAGALAGAGGRALLGITGKPGAGKSTVAARLVAALGDRAVLVPMDGYHLSNEVLLALGRRDRKGAIDTFDAAGYLALLRRLAGPEDAVVYAPRFERALEEPIAGAIPVPPGVPLVVTEGNYLLAGEAPWPAVRGLLDAAWYLDPPDGVRVPRLVARHEAYGKDHAAAQAWARGSDQRNAELVAATRARADLVVELVEDER